MPCEADDTTSTVTICLLADMPVAEPVLAHWFVEAWAPYYGPAGPGDAAGDLAQCRNRDSIPLALVAVDAAGEALGTAALKEQPLPGHEKSGPWLAALVVRPDRRREGIGRALVAAIEDEARRLGFGSLYTGMTRAESGLLRGWTVVAANAPTLREPVTVFRKDLA